MTLQTLIVERHDAVTLIRLNGFEALNALNGQLMDELTAALDESEADRAVRCVVLTGAERAVAAAKPTSRRWRRRATAEVFTEDFITRNWEAVTRCRKPVIAAVHGYALGGGCELAMMCDFIIAADNARFGQPEINLGVIPGAGGTQRRTRFVGKSKAMDMVLTARMMNAEEANQCGLVSRVVPLAESSFRQLWKRRRRSRRFRLTR